MAISSNLPMQPQDGWLNRMNAFLDKYILPIPIQYLTNRLTILATLCLLIPLIALANNQAFELAVNSYLNVMSVVVSSTVLLYSTISEARDRAAVARREEIAAKHQEMIDARAEADHQKLELVHQHLDEMNRELNEHVSKSLANIERLLMDELQRIHDEDRQHIERVHQQVTNTTNEHQDRLADLAAMVKLLQDNLNAHFKPGGK